MKETIKTIAIIPARGGSKRVFKKNIRPFLGRPIIEYSIEMAKKSDCFDEVMVSTDCPEIACVARKAGAEVPFLRSKERSDDYATIADVMVEVISEYKQRGIIFDKFCCIFPTAPTISVSRIKEGYNLLSQESIDGVMAVTEFEYPIKRALKIVNGKVSMINPENERKRSQDLELVYHDAGRFIWARTSSFMRKESFFMNNLVPIYVPMIETQDIDTEDDWKVAELKYIIAHHKDQLINSDLNNILRKYNI